MGKIDFDRTNEAFRAGNRARKKESVQDTVDSVYSIQEQIDLFREQTGIELEIRDGRPYFGESLDLSGCTGLTRLPDRLKVRGSMWLIGLTGLTSLPIDLEVEGDLDPEGCTGLTSLQAGLKVGGELILTDCTGLISLPADLKVEGNLYLTRCTGLTSLPNGLKIEGDLWMGCCTGLTSLPAGLEVGGSLVMNDCTGLTSLHASLEVGKDLCMPHCTGLTSLPAGLKVGGDLYLTDCTGLTGLPSDLIVQGSWIIHYGTLTPFFKKLRIPVNKDGNTKAENWRKWQESHEYIKEAFRVGNEARKKESIQDAVESVDNIQEQIDLFKEQTGIELEIRNGRPHFDGDLDLNDCTGLTSLPDNLEVNGYLLLTGCTGLTGLPKGLNVRGNLDLSGCTRLTGLPSDLVVQGIWIEHTGVLTQFFKKLGIQVDDEGDTKASDWCEWQKAHGYINEAFRAGNRARKKETVQDNTDAVSRWRIPKKLETIDDWEAAFLLNTESVGITAALRQSDSPSSTTRIYNLYVRSAENNSSVTFSVAISRTDFYSENSSFGITMRVIFKLHASTDLISMHMVPVRDAERNSAGRKAYTDLSEALDAVYEIINYLRSSRHIIQVLKNPLILELNSSDVTMLVIEEYLRSEPGCPLIWDHRDEDVRSTFPIDYKDELKRATAVGPWINWHGDTEVLAEAFKAGNRARKRESISGTSNIVGTRVPSIKELGDMLLDLGFMIRSDKRDYAETCQEKASEEIRAILFSKWYTPSGKAPENGPIKESMILLRGGYGLLNGKESGQKIPYISAEIHVDIMLDKRTVGKYRMSSLSSSWSCILNLTVFDKVDEEFMPRLAVLMKLWSESDRILKGLHDMLKDNLLIMRVDQYIQKAYVHRLLCRLMPEFEPWIYSEGFGSGKEIDPDSWQWQASGWIKIPEAPAAPVNEAFKAGNRARKRDAVQDTVSDNVDPLIKFEDPNVEKICHEHGVYTIGDAARVDTIQEWFEIDSGAGIDNLEIVKFNELRYFTGLTTIPANAFLEQEKLEEIVIPDNVTVIGQCAFDSCRNLSKLVLPDRNSLELGNDCFRSTPALDVIVVPSGWSRWECIQNMKEAYDNELVWYQEKIDENHIDEDHYFELLDDRLITTFENRQGTLDCRFDDLLQWWTGDNEYVPDDEEEMDEAFKAGNRARKKESAADSVESYGALDTRNRCAEVMKAMLTSPICPAVRIIGDQPAGIGNAPAIDPTDIKISEHLGNNQDYTLVVLKWEGVDQIDPAQNLTYVTEISFSEATDGSGLLISGGCFNDDNPADFSPLPDMCIRADAENDGRTKLWELCYVEDWETVDPDGMTYSKVSVNAIAAVAAAVRQIKEQDRRKDPSSAGKYPVGEAFKAGNRARKRESVQDAASDNIDTPVRFEDPVVRRYMEDHEITTISKVVNAILPTWDADEQEDWLKPERFNEFKLFTSITHIKEFMFNAQENLEEIELPPTVQSIGYAAFRSCLSLKVIAIPESCREIGYDCLAGCDSLEWIDFPGSWTYEYAFRQFARAFNDDIENLSNILADNDVGSWDEMPFPDTTITNSYYTFYLSDLLKKFGDQDTLEAHGLLDEAFKASNRARKKEAAADTVESVPMDLKAAVYAWCANMKAVIKKRNMDKSIPYKADDFYLPEAIWSDLETENEFESEENIYLTGRGKNSRLKGSVSIKIDRIDDNTVELGGFCQDSNENSEWLFFGHDEHNEVVPWIKISASDLGSERGVHIMTDALDRCWNMIFRRRISDLRMASMS